MTNKASSVTEVAKVCDDRKASLSARDSTESEPDRLREEIRRLQRENRDYEIALLASNEHGDLIQEHLYRLSTSLAAEIRERQGADEKLQRLVKAISKEKGDLEVLVQILIAQGDDAAEDGEKARIDALTQIANRRRFDEFLSAEWSTHLRAQQPLSLLICDVDHFKLYNDRHGHQAGDDCLKAVAQVTARGCPARGLVARYGGEEFAVILPFTSHEVAIAVAEDVRSGLAAAAIPHLASPVCDRVTISIGVACRKPQQNETQAARGLIEEADQYLYLAKHRGRDRAAYSMERTGN
jgi:diguanylate cyclase (GGDEF)-like protein